MKYNTDNLEMFNIASDFILFRQSITVGNILGCQKAPSTAGSGG